MEEWKVIPGYEGLYEITTDGRVRSLNYMGKKGKIQELKLGLHKKKYFRVILGKNGSNKLFLIHQLVAMVFLGHIPKGHELLVDHINSNSFDNRIENLKITTHRGNLSKERTVKSGLPVGVSKYRGKYTSRIRIKGKQIFLGCYSTPEEASQAYQKELKNYEKNQLQFRRRKERQR